MLFGVPPAVKTFFRPVLARIAKPIRRSLPFMVLALLLAPHRRCLKTLAGMVLGHREHVATISRRLRNRLWKTRDWYVQLFETLWSDTNRWERKVAGKQKRQWMLVIDTTYHGTMSQCMENLICFSRIPDSRKRSTANHAFLKTSGRGTVAQEHTRFRTRVTGAGRVSPGCAIPDPWRVIKDAPIVAK